jgi:hypothetical protein
MGKLAEDVTRLCGEMRTSRRNRQALRKELEDGTKDRQRDIFELCADFAETRARMAKRTLENRLAFLNNLQRNIDGQRREMRADLAVSRCAWAGRC